jgi:hypothetical protein
MFGLLGNTIRRLEKNKHGMTRSLLAEAIKPTLTGENQLLYEQARSAVYSSKEGSYEMNLPALATPRAKKVNEDGKNPKTLEMKNNLKRIRLEKEYDTVKKISSNQMGYKRSPNSYKNKPSKPYGNSGKNYGRQSRDRLSRVKHSGNNYGENNRYNSNNRDQNGSVSGYQTKNGYSNGGGNPNGNNRFQSNRGNGNQPNGNKNNFKPRAAPYPNGKQDFNKNNQNMQNKN